MVTRMFVRDYAFRSLTGDDYILYDSPRYYNHHFG